jgi:hypothetical protein
MALCLYSFVYCDRFCIMLFFAALNFTTRGMPSRASPIHCLRSLCDFLENVPKLMNCNCIAVQTCTLVHRHTSVPNLPYSQWTSSH